jgi:polyphosphate kinase
MESVMPVQNPHVKKELERILSVYESDNTNSWEMQTDGTYIRRTPEQGSEPITAQQVFV